MWNGNFCLLIYLEYFDFFGLLVFANQPTVHSGGGSVAVAVGINDR